MNKTAGLSYTPALYVRYPPLNLKSGGGAKWVGNERPTMQTQTAIAPTTPVRDPLILQILRPIMVAFGLGLTAAWISFLGYGLVTLVGFVI